MTTTTPKLKLTEDPYILLLFGSVSLGAGMGVMLAIFDKATLMTGILLLGIGAMMLFATVQAKKKQEAQKKIDAATIEAN